MNSDPRKVVQTERSGATRLELKRVAQRMFAEHGIAAIGMRQIVEAAGQRNAAAIHYYFGSKDDLIRELLIDGADAIDTQRHAMLDGFEAQERDIGLRAVVRALVLPSDAVYAGGETTYLRFLSNVMAERRPLFDETIRPAHATAYARCIAHTRRLLAPLAKATIDRRLLYAGLTMQAILAAREPAIKSDAGNHGYWGDEAVAALLDCVYAILTGPVGEAAA